MSKCVLIKVVNREIYANIFNSVEEAWHVVVKEYNEFCEEQEIGFDSDCKIYNNELSAWANGWCECVDWKVFVIE